MEIVGFDVYIFRQSHFTLLNLTKRKPKGCDLETIQERKILSKSANVTGCCEKKFTILYLNLTKINLAIRQNFTID